ncbi:MAG: SAM hydroxide adenosyltransferase, partial [Candidatus Thorarchaeota archaeon]
TNIPIIDEKIKGTNFILQKGSTLMLETDENKYQGILQSEYKNTELNQLIFIKGSSGYLEISMNQDSAAEKLNLKAGDSIQIRF